MIANLIVFTITLDAIIDITIICHEDKKRTKIMNEDKKLMYMMIS